uniref:Transmembrane protein 199 n=1 Tax=Caenorhabditis japonica TaxID=281687 RepID=A0A8R1HNQ2_CAEJA
MAEWDVSEENKNLLRDLIAKSACDLSTENQKVVKDFTKKDVITYKDLVNIKEKLPEDVPVFVFFDRLTLRHEDHTYKASAAFRKKTEELKVQQEQDSYKRLIRDVDPAQKYGRTDHMENFGVEMRTVNRQMMSVVNVVITVVGAFFFGFSGVTYAYPHLKLDLATRFIIGLVPATIVFFCDLYFVVKGMDFDEHVENLKEGPSAATFSFKNMEDKKND